MPSGQGGSQQSLIYGFATVACFWGPRSTPGGPGRHGRFHTRYGQTRKLVLLSLHEHDAPSIQRRLVRSPRQLAYFALPTGAMIWIARPSIPSDSALLDLPPAQSVRHANEARGAAPCKLPSKPRARARVGRQPRAKARALERGRRTAWASAKSRARAMEKRQTASDRRRASERWFQESGQKEKVAVDGLKRFRRS